jgi:hypothetical protein
VATVRRSNVSNIAKRKSASRVCVHRGKGGAELEVAY